MLDLLFTGRGGAIAAPTGLIVLLAIGFAMIDAGDDLDLEAQARGEAVNHELSSTTTMATWAAAGVGVVVLLAGGGLALSMLRENEEEELPVHGGGPPPPSGGGIDI